MVEIERGDAFKSQLKYTKERFFTIEGLLVMVLGGLVWGYLVVQYTVPLYQSIRGNFPAEPKIIMDMISYAIFGGITSLMSLLITFIIVQFFRQFFKGGNNG